MTNNTKHEHNPKTVHIYLAIRRKKENPWMKSHKEELCFRAIDCDEHSLDLLKHRLTYYPGVWRIYKTVNPRNTAVAKKLVLKWHIDELYSDYYFPTLYNKALLQKECRVGKLALVDVDTKIMPKVMYIRDLIIEATGEIPELVVTPNGFHLISVPFDKRLFSEYEYVSINYDGYVFVDRLVIE